MTPLPDPAQDLDPAGAADLVLSPGMQHLVVAASFLPSSAIPFEADEDSCILTDTPTSSAPGEATGPFALSTLELGGKTMLTLPMFWTAVFRRFELVRREWSSGACQ